MEIRLHEASELPASVLGAVNEIAEESCQAAFGVIAERLGELGWPVAGDFGPGEVGQLDEVFRMFVRSMAANLIGEATPRESLVVGARVRLRDDVERYPHFVADAGMAGTVTTSDRDVVTVRMDDALQGAEEWDNEIVWSVDDGDNPMRDLLLL